MSEKKNNIIEMDENIIDKRIEQFLKGQMSQDEETAFKQEIEENKDLRERAIATALLIKSVSSVGRTNDNKIVNAVKLRQVFLWSTSIAAAIILIIGSLQFFIYRDSINLYDRYANVVIPSELNKTTYNEPTGITRDGETVDSIIFNNDTLVRDTLVENDLIRIRSEIKQKRNLNENIEKLNDYYNKATLNPECPYQYLADDIVWNLALGYLAKGEKGETFDLLNQYLRKYPDTKIRPQIESLIRDIG